MKSNIFLGILFGMFMAVLVWSIISDVRDNDTRFTRICAERGGSFQCNDYDGWRYVGSGGCVEIEITKAKSYICGDYTIEHRIKKD